MTKYIYIRKDVRFEEEPIDTNYLQLVYEEPEDLQKIFVRLRQVDKEFQSHDSYDYYVIGTLTEEKIELFEEQKLVFKGANRCQKKSTQE